jgi:transcription-repair coupling factor (superfamily II helicase)
MISRFRTAKQQKEILQKVETGKVDILIGTHRLLSKDIKFTDLGLLVVDEEQRFGVRHKERLKQMRKEVDVLTMSATPIPRTLHMSLVGMRDMSVIETPPKDRIAIQTVVASWDEKLIRSSIEQELDRGGQVYFVHNRVESIWEIAAKLQELAPRARIIVGHGQMSEGELEKVMLKFMHHEADILVATTIIENGLDIPLCNTIVINRADRFGLSELYQLRGRVGRSNRRAYAYLLIPADIELTPIARRRLAALKEFSDLGWKSPRRRAERTHRSHRLRAVHPDARSCRPRNEGRRRSGRGRDSAQPRPQYPYSGELHPGREPAPAHVQARCRSRNRIATE